MSAVGGKPGEDAGDGHGAGAQPEGEIRNPAQAMIPCCWCGHTSNEPSKPQPSLRTTQAAAENQAKVGQRRRSPDDEVVASDVTSPVAEDCPFACSSFVLD